MSGIRTNAAAELLGVSPNTLRSWERRFGYPEAAPDPGRPPPVRPRGAGVAAPRAARDAQHLVGDRARPPARRGAELAEPPARRLRPLRRDARPTAIMEESLAVRSVERTRRGGAAARARAGGRARRPRRRARAGAALGDRLAPRRAPRRARRRPARRACSCSTRARGSTSSRCTCRRSSSACAAPGFRTLLLAFDLPPERVVRAIRALDPVAFVFCGGEATLEVVGRLVYTVRQVGSAAPVFEYREAMPVTGDHGIPSLGSHAGRGGRAPEGLRGQRPHRAGRGRAGARGRAERAHQLAARTSA